MTQPWYADGLRFSCTKCGNCCTGEPGFTWVNDDEVTALAARLGVGVPEFRRRFTNQVWRNGERRTSLRDEARAGIGRACVFFKRGVGCTVYEDRPRQCLTWPFWQRNIATPEAWAELADECPGVGRGETHDAARIAAIASDDGLS